MYYGPKNMFRICGGRSGTETGFSPSALVSPVCHSTVAVHSHMSYGGVTNRPIGGHSSETLSNPISVNNNNLYNHSHLLNGFLSQIHFCSVFKRRNIINKVPTLHLELALLVYEPAEFWWYLFPITLLLWLFLILLVVWIPEHWHRSWFSFPSTSQCAYAFTNLIPYWLTDASSLSNLWTEDDCLLRCASSPWWWRHWAPLKC
jgi:hypothetical protein